METVHLRSQSSVSLSNTSYVFFTSRDINYRLSFIKWITLCIPPLPPSNAVAQPTRLLHAETPQPPHQTEGQTSLIGLLGLLESYTVPGMWRHGLIPWYCSTALFRCEEGTSDCTPTASASRLLRVLLGARVWYKFI